MADAIPTWSIDGESFESSIATGEARIPPGGLLDEQEVR